MYYSAEKKGFFEPSVHAVIPRDAMEITQDEWRGLLSGQALGQRIVPDESGRPILVDAVAPAPTPEDVKTEAARRISAVMPDWMIAREVSGGDPIPQAVKDYAAAVRKASDTLENMNPIPQDFTDARWWPVSPVSE